MPGSPVLSARALAKVYTSGDSSLRALDGVSLDVERGRFLSIMGPSGSGKSTLLHLLGGLDTPTEGEVFLEGRALSSLSDKEITLARRTGIGLVFQFFNLVPVLTVEENVALPAVIQGQRPKAYRERLDTVLELVGLTAWRTHLPSQISGGQQQRVAIARALFPEPAVLLADEPTGNLDSHTGLDVLGLLQDARRDLGQTIVMVTHDPRAAAFGDEVILIRDGRIGGRLNLQTGKATRVRRRGEQARVRTEHNGAGEDRAQLVLAWLQELGA